MDYGVERIYHPHDGMELGLEAMIADLIERTATARRPATTPARPESNVDIAAMISAIEAGMFADAELMTLRKEWQVQAGQAPVVGITGTGGAGKSSVTDEILNRFLTSFPSMRIAVLAVDPTRRRTGGALLGDRIRMNSLRSDRVYMRSIATRRQHLATSEMLGDHILFLKSRRLRPGHRRDGRHRPERQRDRRPGRFFGVRHDQRIRRGEPARENRHARFRRPDRAQQVRQARRRRRAARRAQAVETQSRRVRRQRRRRAGLSRPSPASSTIPASAGCSPSCAVSWPARSGLDVDKWTPDIDTSIREPRATAMIPGARIRYLAEIAEQGARYQRAPTARRETASRAQHLYEALRILDDPLLPAELRTLSGRSAGRRQRPQPAAAPAALPGGASVTCRPSHSQLLREWPERKRGVRDEKYSYTVRGREITGDNLPREPEPPEDSEDRGAGFHRLGRTAAAS